MKVGPLTYTTNKFNAAIVTPDSLAGIDRAEFGRWLSKGAAQWKDEGLWTAWLQIPIKKSELIPEAVSLGFTFHHSQRGYLMLTLQLQAGAIIPPYATHYAGVGGIVINERDELLIVVEQADRVDRPNYYKLPGGALLAGEHIADGIIREVWEETGVETRFESLVMLRHWHEYRYGKSDFYFACRLAPLSDQIKKQDSEIYACQWMPANKFLAHGSVGIFSKRVVEHALKVNRGMAPSWLEGYDKDPATREIFVVPQL
ncbi:MAG: NUDIX domain-containing protein [Chloroflexi bacterium]|nr:NUDIX domain-containing protein [Chloroflexota bacterium]